MPLPQRVLYYGVDEPLPESIELRAGPLTLVYSAGDLRYVSLHGRLVVLRAYWAVRDHNWGTVPIQIANQQIDVNEDSFSITYNALCRQHDVDFRAAVTIEGSPDGAVSFGFDGRAYSTFSRNRLGFCLLHPAATAGTMCEVEHGDSTRERAALPEAIRADQPVLPFTEMRGLRQDLGDGVTLEIEFEGELFDLEDQRNWIDASFKSFCTPLGLPYPVQVPEGTQIAQAIRWKVQEAGQQPASAPNVTADSGINFELLPATAALPRIGLCAASDGHTITPREADRLRLLRLDHLRVDLNLAEGRETVISRLRNAMSDAHDLDVSLHVALILGQPAEDELQELASIVDQERPNVAAWLVFAARETMAAATPYASLVAAARKYLGSHDRRVTFVGGTNADFIFFNRFVPEMDEFDGVCIPTNPQTHAFDNSSLVESLGTIPALVRSTRLLAGSRPVFIGPVTLKPRWNPYASAPPGPVAPGELPREVDVRQLSLFGAGWTLGSLKYLAESGADVATYYETTGWRGLMEREEGSSVPERFQSIPAGVFPLYHVFADVAEYAGGNVVVSRSSDPQVIDGIALRKDGRTRLLLANFTGRTQQVTVRGVSGAAQLRHLDETNAEHAMSEPEAFRASPGNSVAQQDGAFTLAIAPYGLARLDI